MEAISISANQTNDIDASSQFGLDGTILINTPDVSLFKKLIKTPEIVELQTLGAKACAEQEIAEASSFNLTGKGGVPPQPFVTS